MFILKITTDVGHTELIEIDRRHDALEVVKTFLRQRDEDLKFFVVLEAHVVAHVDGPLRK